MRLQLAIIALLALTAGRALAAGSFDGNWDCTFAKTPFGTLKVYGTGYYFSDQMQGGESSGQMAWDDGLFQMTSGGLKDKYGVTSGFAYHPADDPTAPMKLDFYSDMGIVASCQKR